MGYAGILRLPTLSSKELLAGIDHLSSLMYLATQFTWSSVCGFHAAILFEIECGQANWGDSFAYLESLITYYSHRLGEFTRVHRVLTALTRLFSSAVILSTGCVKLTRTIMVCFGERENAYNIFVPAVGWSQHTEFSKECPLASHKNSSPSTTDTTTP